MNLYWSTSAPLSGFSLFISSLIGLHITSSLIYTFTYMTPCLNSFHPNSITLPLMFLSHFQTWTSSVCAPPHYTLYNYIYIFLSVLDASVNHLLINKWALVWDLSEQRGKLKHPATMAGTDMWKLINSFNTSGPECDEYQECK